jgi:hypothetical protein
MKLDISINRRFIFNGDVTGMVHRPGIFMRMAA